ncbi:hypothetical protein SAMN05444126_11740 [Salisediminibacterium halotolerans]|uniref:Uncharacterized protein n=1 Tax=Salisediminibacterium halotolerans TaxID=517425 RepID=A0A1H9V1H8_9BACI|nr:hypothetical protein SAMN05444126_11740 [Salisediminibacterium haloalkalitolerans]
MLLWISMGITVLTLLIVGATILYILKGNG